MLNWSIEKCLEMSAKLVKIGEDYKHEADTIQRIVQDHPELAGLYLARIKEISTTMEIVAHVSFTINYYAMRHME